MCVGGSDSAEEEWCVCVCVCVSGKVLWIDH